MKDVGINKLGGHESDAIILEPTAKTEGNDNFFQQDSYVIYWNSAFEGKRGINCNVCLTVAYSIGTAARDGRNQECLSAVDRLAFILQIKKNWLLYATGKGNSAAKN